MLRWAGFPFVRITLVFIAGVLLAIFEVLPLEQDLAFSLVPVLLLTFIAMRWYPARRVRKWSGTVGLLTIHLLGFISVIVNTATLRPEHLIHVEGEPDYYLARIASYPHEKEKTWRHEATVEHVHVGEAWQRVSGKIQIYQSRRGSTVPFAYGDMLLIMGSPQRVRGPINPGEFDYQRFLSYRNIFHQHHVAAGQVRWIGNRPGNPVMAMAMQARSWSETQIDSLLSGDRERAVAKALILGITDGLDNELTAAYSATGAMHVLAVSGLHVSIIYAILLVLLRPLRHVRHGIAFQAGIALLLLWLYAAVTGLSPSVLRAVTMFSFVVLARPFGQETNIYNTLAVAAFCLLLFDPMMIMSVGFQLSFLAVIGIVYLHPLLYDWWEPKSYWLDQIWKVSCVSIAAQLATFPLGLLYFHQFPNYFLISNLIVIPASFAVLVGGLVLLVAAPFAWVGNLVGVVLDKLIWLLNEFVLWIESWPYSLSENWYISTWQCWVLLAMVISWILLFRYRQLRWLYIATVFALFFAGGYWYRFTREIAIDRLTVYQVSRYVAFDLISAGVAFQQVDSMLLHDDEGYRFHLAPNRLRAAVHTIRTLADYPASEIRGGIVWAVRKGNVIAYLAGKSFSFPTDIKIDWLVVSGTALRDLSQIPPSVSVGCLVFDGSCPSWLVGKLTHQARVRGWRIHRVSEKAFQIQL